METAVIAFMVILSLCAGLKFATECYDEELAEKRRMAPRKPAVDGKSAEPQGDFGLFIKWVLLGILAVIAFFLTFAFLPDPTPSQWR